MRTIRYTPPSPAADNPFAFTIPLLPGYKSFRVVGVFLNYTDTAAAVSYLRVSFGTPTVVGWADAAGPAFAASVAACRACFFIGGNWSGVNVTTGQSGNGALPQLAWQENSMLVRVDTSSLAYSFDTPSVIVEYYP